MGPTWVRRLTWLETGIRTGALGWLFWLSFWLGFRGRAPWSRLIEVMLWVRWRLTGWYERYVHGDSDDRRIFWQQYRVSTAEDLYPDGAVSSYVPSTYGTTWQGESQTGMTGAVERATAVSRVKALSKHKKVYKWVAEIRARIPRELCREPTAANRKAVARELCRVFKENNVRPADAMRLESLVVEAYFQETVDDVVASEVSSGTRSEPVA